MAKKQALGKGLSALLGGDGGDFSGFEAGERVTMLPLAELHANPEQPRRHFDEDRLAELAGSIRSHGVMQPLLVVRQEEGYLIVAGERRFRAAGMAGLQEVPCIVRRLDARELAEISLIENIQREDLGPLEEAEAYRALMDLHGYTQETLAERLGKSRPHIANTLRLLKLAPQDRKLLTEGRISAGHARALLSLADARKRAQLTAAIINQQLSVRQAEAMAARLREEKAAPARRSEQVLHEDIARQCSARLGLRVRVTGSQGRGRVVIDYHCEDDLQNILDAILKP